MIKEKQLLPKVVMVTQQVMMDGKEATSCELSQRAGASAAPAEGQGAIAPGAARERKK
jgi:hypothetical protein